MQLPPTLRQAIGARLNDVAMSELVRAAGELSERYRCAEAPALNAEVYRLAYAAVRMPATFAAVSAALQEVYRLSPVELRVRSFLDLGAGPGTASWAASEIFQDITQFQLVEHNAGVIDLGRKLLAQSSRAPLVHARWTEAGLESFTPQARHDLAVFSYSLGELNRTDARTLLDRVWNATDWFVVIVEPGTPRGFSLIREMRHHLLGMGGHLIAPCPHMNACPLQNGDWCHFAARVERTAEHRRIKSASLGFEDEKYSYVAVSRRPLKMAQSRVTRHPQHFPGFIKLQLCSPEGQQQVAVTKKAKDLFRRARKVRWGDGWPE